MDTRSIAYKRPVVLLLNNSDAFVRRVIREECNHSTNVDWRAEKLKDFIDSHSAGGRLSIEEVCKALGLHTSVRQARRLFKEAAGISMKDYTRKKRLVLAAKQLQSTDEPIKVIAADAGYHTHHGFRKAFYEMFRLAPLEFRRFWPRRHVAA